MHQRTQKELTMDSYTREEKHSITWLSQITYIFAIHEIYFWIHQLGLHSYFSKSDKLHVFNMKGSTRRYFWSLNNYPFHNSDCLLRNLTKLRIILKMTMTTQQESLGKDAKKLKQIWNKILLLLEPREKKYIKVSKALLKENIH